jgi:hypothetical protein
MFTGVCVAGCDENLADVAGPTPNLTPTFSSIQREIFVTADPSGRSACVRCHVPGRSGFREVGMDLSPDLAYAHLVGVPSREKPGLLRVAPGDPDNSYLIHKLEGRGDIIGDRMPQRAEVLTDGQIQIIRRWIQRGAPRD